MSNCIILNFLTEHLFFPIPVQSGPLYCMLKYILNFKCLNFSISSSIVFAIAMISCSDNWNWIILFLFLLINVIKNSEIYQNVDHMRKPLPLGTDLILQWTWDLTSPTLNLAQPCLITSSLVLQSRFWGYFFIPGTSWVHAHSSWACSHCSEVIIPFILLVLFFLSS